MLPPGIMLMSVACIQSPEAMLIYMGHAAAKAMLGVCSPAQVGAMLLSVTCVTTEGRMDISGLCHHLKPS